MAPAAAGSAGSGDDRRPCRHGPWLGGGVDARWDWRRSDPPVTARRLKESTLTRSRSMRPASPSSLAGSRLHGVEVRAMKMSAPRSCDPAPGVGRRRADGVVGLGAAAGCVATARQGGVGPPGWSWPAASQDSLNPSSRSGMSPSSTPNLRIYCCMNRYRSAFPLHCGGRRYPCRYSTRTTTVPGTDWWQFQSRCQCGPSHTGPRPA